MSDNVTIVFAPKAIRNGMAAAKRMGNLVEHLKADHHVVNVYKSDESGSGPAMGVAYYSYRFFIGELRRLRNIKKSRSGNRLFYYHYGYPSVKNLFNLLAIRALGYRVVLDIVEDYRAILPLKKGFVRRFNIKASIWLLKHSARFVNGYVAISPHLEQMMNGYFAGRRRVLLLPISINSHYYPTPVENATGKLSFFYGGSFAPKDDFRVMMNAYLKVYDRYPGKIDRLYLAGKCPTGKQQALLEEAGPSRAHAIKFVGYLEDNTYYDFIGKSDVLVMPRNNSDFANTGFPFKLGEYMATGHCVISARLPAVVDAVGEHSVLYYKPENEESLTDAFNLAVTDPEACHALGSRARALAFELFDARKHAKKLADFLMSL